MALKTVEINGRKWVLGRKAPSSQERTFRSGQSLLGSTIPPPPATIAIPASCANGLSQTFMNTQLGCCVIAHHAHFLANITSQNGQATPFIYTENQIIKDYEVVGGYIPGDPFSDQGCDISTDLAYLTSTGFADGSKLLASTNPNATAGGSINIDPTSQLALTQSVWITGGVCFGMSMPDAWINPAPQQSGFVWDVAGQPDDSNGHCFEGFAYPTSQGIAIATWGMVGTITWAAIAKYGAASSSGEVHSYVNPEMINPATGLAPNGLNLNQICTYFNAMGGSVVVPPAPNPTPVPTPTPTPTPTPVSVNVPFGIYNLTISGTPTVPAPLVTVPSPVTVTWAGQTLVISATMASGN